MIRDRAILLVLALVAVGVFGVDFALDAGTVLPAAVYAVPIVIAAWALPPRSVAALSVWTGLLELAAAALQRPPLWLFVVYMLGIIFFGALGTALSVKIRREADLGHEARVRADALQNIAEENARLYRQTEFEKQRWQTTVESMLEPVTVSDAEGHAIYMNAAYTRLVGFTIEQGLSLQEHPTHYGLYHSDGSLFQAEDLPLQRAALQDEEVRNLVVLTRTGDGGEMIALWNASPIHDAEGRVIGAVAVGRDITEQRRLEEQRDDLIRALSHDLRTPLTAVLGRAQLLSRAMEAAGMEARLRDNAVAIIEAAKRMNSMIQDLSDTSRLESGQIRLDRQPVYLASFVPDLVARSAGALDESRIRVDIPAGVPPVMADPRQLERILTNLLTNALKYSPSESPVLVTAQEGEDQVEVSVIDRGLGISPEDRSHLFQRYFRAREARKTDGLGLGLFITKGLVEAHGGQVRLESEPGKGSTFTFGIPRAES